MKKLSKRDGSWESLLDQWGEMAATYGEDFNAFLPDTMSLLSGLIDDTEDHRFDGVFAAIADDGLFEAVCFVNCAHIPGYVGRVQRVRHLLLSPRSDFGEYDESWYGHTLGVVFEKVIALSDRVFGCSHVKIHFRSPADVAVFRKVQTSLQNSAHFESVKLAGAWLALTKR